MKSLLAKLFRRSVEPTKAPEPDPTPAVAQVPRKLRYRNGKPRHPAPKGARRIDPNGPLIEQARQAGGIKR